MANNTDEEKGNIPESQSNEIGSNTENPTNPSTEIENMEVHHHTHAAHGKKSWKSYFWEFIMVVYSSTTLMAIWLPYIALTINTAVWLLWILLSLNEKE